jgi:pimeloyl-ACP methyl ester carboxylesterase
MNARVDFSRTATFSLHLIDRPRHLVQWDAPEEFAARAAEFLT